MVDNTYWTNKQTGSPAGGRPAIARKRRTGDAKPEGTPRSQWWAFSVAGSLTLMLCVTINFRAISEMNTESVENTELENHIQLVTNENLALQEQIHYLKNDPSVIEREARKIRTPAAERKSSRADKQIERRRLFVSTFPSQNNPPFAYPTPRCPQVSLPKTNRGLCFQNISRTTLLKGNYFD